MNIQDEKGQKLALSELRYRRLFETAQDGILLIDFETGMIMDINRFLIDMLGYSKDVFLKKHLWNIGIFKDIAASKEHFETLQKKKYVRFEDLPLQTKSGEAINVEFVANAYQVGKDTIIQCNIRNITDRKKVENKLKESEYFFRESQKAANFGSYKVDFVSGFWESSEVLNKIFGISRNYKKNIQSWLDIVYPDDRKMMDEYLKEVISKRKLFNKEYRIVRKSDGETRWVLDLGKIDVDNMDRVVMMFGTIQDITERKKVEHIAQISEIRYRRLFETAKDGVLLVDYETGMIIDVNKFLIELLGYSKKDFLKKHLWEVGIFKDIAASKSNFLTLQKKEYVRFEDLPLETKDGRKIDVEFVANAYRENSKKIIQCNVRNITERKKSDEKLNIITKEMMDLYTNAPIGYHSLDKDGVFININNTELSWIGYSRNEVIGKMKLTDIITQSSIQIFKKTFPVLKERGWLKSLEIEYRCKNGTVIPVLLNAVAIYDSSGNFLMSRSSVSDITERKHAEQRVIDSEEKYAKAFQTAPYGIVISSPEKGKIYEANNIFLSMIGYTRKEALKTSTLQMNLWVNKKDRQFVLKDLEKDRIVKNREYLFRKKNGDILIVSFSAQKLYIGKTLYILSSIDDITSRKRAEKLVVDIKTRDEAILNSIGDAVFATDTNGKILLFNKMAQEMTGIPADMAIGRHYSKIVNFVSEISGKPSNDFIAAAIKNNQITIMANHMVLVRKDGEKIPVADSAAPIEDSTGTIMGGVVVFHNVTKERQVDKAKTEFVSLASHQLRTPLSTINWYSEMLLSEDVGKVTPEQRRYTKEVYHASQRMAKLVGAILNVSRLEMGTFVVEPELVDIVHSAKNCLKELNPQILKKKLVVNERYDRSISTVKVDPKLLTIIFQNLLSNSVKYTEKMGKIDLTISKEKDMMLITVSDNGIGIPKDQQSEIFGKLFRADNAKKIDPDGSGLGLYIVKQIINSVGGNVWFKSSKGGETVFYASLPLSGMLKKVGDKYLTT